MGKRASINKKPRIHIESITNGDDYDFFPHLNITGNSAQRDIIKQLKKGSYMPLMRQVPYAAEVDPETHHLYKASPEDNLVKSTPRDIFDYTSDPKIKSEYNASVYMKKRQEGKTSLELQIDIYDKTNIPIRPRYYHNPLQYFDHVLLADGYVNSFAGTCVDMLLDFIMPKRLKPVLLLRHPDKHGPPEQQQKLIEENQEIIQKLLDVDEFYSDDGPKAQDSYMGMPLQEKFKALIRYTLTFGRNCLAFENWEHLPHVKIDGEEYEDIPNVIKTIQSIDMGMVEIDLYTGKLGGIYMYNSVPFVATKNMLYLVNKFANPMIGSLYYGFSVIQRAIDPIRLYRRILARNFMQFVRTSYSGMGMFLFDSTQYDPATRSAIRAAITNAYQAGEIGVIDYANIKDFDFKEIKITPEITALIQLHEAMVKIMVAIIGMPQSIIFDEAAANRATLVGRVLSFLQNQVPHYRGSFGAQISSQWYMRNFRIIYENRPEILEMFKIGVEFEEMEFETKTEKVERLLQEMQLNPLTDEYIGQQLNDPDYLNHIDADKKKLQEQQQSSGPLASMMKPKPKTVFSVKDSMGNLSKVSSSD